VKPEYKLSATLDLDEGFFTDLQYMVIPKGHPGDDDAVHALVNFALSADVQAAMAEEVWYGPINQDVKLPDSVRNSPYIPSAEVVASKGNHLDKDYLATVRDEWIRRYNEALNG
jgi:putative spermidine/putrescine transport system substrate-binding protein